MTNILHLHDNALFPLTDNPLLNTTLSSLVSFRRQVATFCHLVKQMAPDGDAILEINRTCVWADDAVLALHQVWGATLVYSDTAWQSSATVWLKLLASCLNAEHSHTHSNTSRPATADATFLQPNNDTATAILGIMAEFLDPASKEGYLPRGVRPGRAYIDAIPPSIRNVQDDVKQPVVETQRRVHAVDHAVASLASFVRQLLAVAPTMDTESSLPCRPWRRLSSWRLSCWQALASWQPDASSPQTPDEKKPRG
ncbi:hypothetical protein ColTof4_14376 [Colletotrichum tofieldiae]|nr:hypothetical protein ColTof3_14788 [Colletotrichum tofieldiae]GKT81953.1 hypothetical protein ColTof4_14376 [Colletotrichum tofieldiae]